MKEILRVEHLKKNYITANNLNNGINDISFCVFEGEFVGIMGASGSGKTTLLNYISTIDSATSGHVFINGKEISNLTESKTAKFRRENLGFVFQDYNLLDTLTVGENITLALTINHVLSKEIDARVADVSKKLGIYDLLNKYPYEISGGEKQRCACARAIVNSPDIILADEPTGSLDSAASENLMELISYINKSQHSTIILVTHDVFVATYAQKIFFLRDGKLCDNLERGNLSKRDYLNEIIKKMSLLGGGVACT